MQLVAGPLPPPPMVIQNLFTETGGAIDQMGFSFISLLRVLELLFPESKPWSVELCISSNTNYTNNKSRELHSYNS